MIGKGIGDELKATFAIEGGMTIEFVAGEADELAFEPTEYGL